MLAVTVCSQSNRQDEGLELLAVRTIEPPSRMSASASQGVPAGEDEDAEGVWRARKGGMSSKVLKRMVAKCLEKGGVGDEVLRGLEEFT